jgi:archaellum component FlaF (FlaF/FlaG flagellin family)
MDTNITTSAGISRVNITMNGSTAAKDDKAIVVHDSRVATLQILSIKPTSS